MKRTLCALLISLTVGCGRDAAAPPSTGFGPLTGEWHAFWAPPDAFAEWSLSLTELSTGYVAGTVTRTSGSSLAPPSGRRVWVDTGSVAGEHRGIDIVLTFLYEDGVHYSYEGRQVEANIFRVEGEFVSDPLDFMRVDP